MSLPPALVLVGGLGTRLRSVYRDRPKALVPILGKPFIAHQLERLHRQGVKHVHLAAGYRGEQLEAWSGHHGIDGLTVTASVEPKPLGTGGGLAYAMKTSGLEAATLLVLNGDSLLPHARLADLDVSSETALSMAVVAMEERGSYGTVETDDEGCVTAFREKAERDSGLVNGGVYLMNRDLVEGVAPDHPSSLEQDLFPDLARRGMIHAVTVPPPLLDMGTPEGIRRMEAWLASTNPV